LAHATDGKRVVKDRASLVSTVFMPTMREVSTSAISAAPIDCLRRVGMTSGFARASARATIGLDLLNLRPTEQTGGPEDEHKYEDCKCRYVLVLDAEIPRPERLYQTDQDTAQHSPRQRADAAKHRCGKSLDAGEKTDEEINHAPVERHHQAGDARERRADHEGERYGAIHIHAEQGGHLHVLLAGTLSAAQCGPIDEQREASHQDQSGDEDDHLQIAELNIKAVWGLGHHDAALDHRLQRLVAGALGDLDEVRQNERHA